MAKRELGALGVAVIALALGSCALTAGEMIGGPYARLGPPDAPGRLHYQEVVEPVDHFTAGSYRDRYRIVL